MTTNYTYEEIMYRPRSRRPHRHVIFWPKYIAVSDKKLEIVLKICVFQLKRFLLVLNLKLCDRTRSTLFQKLFLGVNKPQFEEAYFRMKGVKQSVCGCSESPLQWKPVVTCFPLQPKVAAVRLSTADFLVVPVPILDKEGGRPLRQPSDVIMH
jgi:hypothetical protein